MVRSRAEVRDRFSTQLEALIASLKAQGLSLRNAGQRLQLELDKNGWDGNPQDLDGLVKPFSREEHRDDVEAAIADADDAGPIGDLVASSWQGDLLACMERSYRAKYSNRVRRSAHAAARREGHASDAGVLRRGMLGTVEGALKQTKDIVT